MEQIRALCNNIIANVVRNLDPLEGSVHSVVADKVRFELEKGMEDILNTLDGGETADTSKFKGVEYIVRGDERFCVCGLAIMLTGEGSKAIGVVGVSWGEKIKWNSGLKVSSNTVTKKTALIWGILVALGVACARGYSKIMIATETPDVMRVMLRDLEEGKLENSDVYAALVRKFKQYKERGVTAVAPNDVEIKGIVSGSAGFLKDAKAIAKKTFDEAKKAAKA